jgi:hypothetical protein
MVAIGKGVHRSFIISAMRIEESYEMRTSDEYCEKKE